MSSDLTPEQIFAFYHTRLTEVLTRYNPAGLKTIETLLRQFPEKEHQVYTQICKKCRVEPVERPTLNDFENGVVKPLRIKPRDERVERWITDNGFGSYVNINQFSTMTLQDFFAISSKGRLIELGVLPKNAALILDAILKERGDDGKQDKPLEPPPFKSDFEVGENCFTKIVMQSNKGGEKWLNARVTNVNDDNSFDIFVYNSKSFNVPPEAVNVPRDMLKKISETVEVAVPQPKKKAKRPQFQSGDRIRVFGLRSHKSYNGLCGTVLLYVQSERRYQVRLDTNDVIAIKQRNVGPIEHDNGTESAMATGTNKPSSSGTVERSDEIRLSELMAKLMQDNPQTDPGKLGEFAAGYLLAKSKINA